MAGRQELSVVLDVADWLGRAGLVVYHERGRLEGTSGGVFCVKGVEPGRHPDLLVCGGLVAARRPVATCHVAVEVKPGNKHHDILDGFDAVLRYFTDYACGARYEIGESEVEVAAIVLVTSFGPQGYLFREEGKFDPKGIVRGPWDAYPMTFTVARLLWRQRDNIVKRLRETLLIPGGARVAGKHGVRFTRPLPDVGVMVSDPRKPERVLLMLSSHPYHWHLQAAQRLEAEAGQGTPFRPGASN